MTKLSLKQNQQSGPVFSCESSHPQGESDTSEQRSSNSDGRKKHSLPLASVGIQHAPPHASESPKAAGHFKKNLLQCTPPPISTSVTSHRVLQDALGQGVIYIRSIHAGSPSSISAMSGNSASTGRICRPSNSSALPREKSEHSNVTPLSNCVAEESVFYTPESQEILEEESEMLLDHEYHASLDNSGCLSKTSVSGYFKTPPRIVRNASAPAEVFIDLFKTPEFAHLRNIRIIPDDVSIMSDSSTPNGHAQVRSPTTTCLSAETHFKANFTSNAEGSRGDVLLKSSGPGKDRSCATEGEGPLVLVTESAFSEEAPVVLVGSSSHSTYINPLPKPTPAATLLNCNAKKNWEWCNRERRRSRVTKIKVSPAKKQPRSTSLFLEDDFLMEQHHVLSPPFAPKSVRHNDSIIENDNDCMPFLVPCLMLGDCQGCSETCNDHPETAYSRYPLAASPSPHRAASQLSGANWTNCKEDEGFGFETEAIFPGYT